MRRSMMTVVMVGLLVAPSLGVINIKLTADQTLLGGEGSTTVRVWAQGTAAGIYSLGGDIVDSGGGYGFMGPASSVAGSMGFTSAFSPTYLLTPSPGSPGTKCGWSGFGSVQTNWLSQDYTLGRDGYVEISHYEIWGSDGDYAVLTFVPKMVAGFKPLECDKTAVIGLNIPVRVVWVPDPATLALLAVGGLLLSHRRRG